MAETNKDDKWIGIYWKPAAAIIYLLICLFDFIVVPSYIGLFADRLSDIIMAAKDLPMETQTVIFNLKLAQWDPLTLKGGGLFHLAFGAILGAEVWSRGQERISEIRNRWNEPAGYQSRGGYNSGYGAGASYGDGPAYPGANNMMPPSMHGSAGNVDSPDGPYGG